MSRNEILAKFRERASAEEVRRFEQMMASSRDFDAQIHALEAVLFKLSEDELFAIGVTSVEQDGRTDWAVAWSSDSDETMRAIEQALDRVGVSGGASCSRRRCGWYVPREEFFAARRALLEIKGIDGLDIQVVEPLFSLR